MSSLSVDIDATWEDRILPALSEYTRIPCLSPAFDPDWDERGAIAAAAELLAAWVKDQDRALQVEIVTLPGRTPVLLIDNGGTGDPILVYGHMDKQPPLGEWRRGLGPWEPVREGDLLYGRGTADDGYATFAAVTGLLAAGGGQGRVLVLIEASEESGSPDLAAHIENLKERIGTPRLVICLDSGGLSYDRLWLTSSLRGNVVVTVQVDVLTEGIHSGQGGGVVPSSFRILRRILSQIEDEATGRILLPELLGAGIPGAQRANLVTMADEFPDSGAPVVDGLHLLTPDPVDRLVARDMGGRPRGDGRRRAAQAQRRRQRPAALDDAQVLAAAPPRRRCSGRHRRADLGHPDRRRGAHHHRRGGGRPRMDRPAAGAGHRGDAGGGIERALRARAGLRRRRRFHPVPRRPAARLPRHPVRGHRCPRSGLQRPRAQRVPQHPDGQGRDGRRRRARVVTSAPPSEPLTGKVALVTGGSRGLGRAMVLAFADAGADVVITSRKLDACAAVAAEVEAMGRRALPVACHIGHWDEIDGLVEQAYATFGRVDVLVNNAGMSPLYPDLTAVSEELWDKVLGVNLKGPFRLTALVGTRMADGPYGGSIINVSSTGSLRPAPGMLPYDAAKAGLNTLTEGFAKAFGPTVRVNCIMAGPFLTDIAEDSWGPAAREHGLPHHALERAGEPGEIVGAALYFATDASTYTSGAILRVDGGIP